MERVRLSALVRNVTALVSALALVMGARVWAQPAGGSILRQLATLQEEIPEVNAWETLTLPESIHDRGLQPAAFQQLESTPQFDLTNPQADVGWSSPYQMAARPVLEEDSSGWYEWLPEGCWPWGPRTPREHRHLGYCFPLEGTSWLNRPCSAGWSAGVLWGDDPLDGRVNVDPGFYGAYRLGWDYDYYWGLEVRLAQATPSVHDRVQNQPDGTADVTIGDVSVMWYPTGDSRLRPYVQLGLGFQHFNFRDDNLHVVNTSCFSMPIGLGVKYMCSPWIALRFEAVENWAMGNEQIDMMSNFTLSGGVEIRFGGHRPSYWPWNPNRHIW
jgi:hypothetical protein